MPTVPNYGGPQASPTSTAGNTFAAPVEQNAAPQQLQQAGDAMQRAGSAASNIAIDMEQQVNQVRVDDALNKARQQMLTLTYDPESGYKTLKGDQALTRPDGQPLVQEYGDKLKTTISDITGTLGNDYQRRAFSMQSNDLMTQFQSGVEQHTLQEYKNYALSTQDGTIKLGTDQAKLHWNDPDQINNALDSVKAAVVRTGTLTGASANETMAQLKATTSAVHESVIAAALQNNNPTYAQQYLQQYKGQMTADDILKTTGLVNHDLDGRIALNAVQGATTKMSGQIQPTDMDRLKGIRDQLESNGKDYNADGTPVTSSTGALYKNQVQPATAANPGFGIVPAKDKSPAEYNRVGDELLDALVKKYGNPAQAMAAYNAGSGNVDKAIADATKAGTPNTWLDALGKYQSASNHLQTVSYVNNTVKKLSTGSGAPQFPTESQFVQSAMDTLGPNPRMEQVKLTRDQAVAQYNVLDKSRKEQGDQAVQQAQQALVQNGGNFASLDPQIKANVTRYAPDKYDNLQDYAGKIADPVRADNLPAYSQAVSHPEELAQMSDPTFESFIQTNFTQRTARQIVKMRDDYVNGKADVSSDVLNNKAVNTTLNNRLLSIGINPTPKPSDLTAKEQLGTIQKYVRDTIYDVQNQTGRKLTPAEVETQITGMFAKDATFQKTLFGIDTGTSSQKLMSMKVGDIPSDTQNQLRQRFIQAGNPKPTDDQLLRAYWKWKNG